MKRCYKVEPKQIEEIMEVIKEFFPENTSIAISDTNEYIYYQPSKKVDLKIKPGDPIKEGSAAYKALTYGQKINSYIESDVFGVPYYGMSIPLIEEGETKGAITAIFPQKPSPFLTNYITVKIDDCWYPIKHNQVIYLETQLRKTFVKTMHREGYHRLNLSDLELFLAPDSFIRCHRSYIVNLQKVREVITWSKNSYSLVLSGKERLNVPLSRSKLVELKEIIGI